MDYGYVRVSTKKQKTERQYLLLLNTVKGLLEENIFEDKITGMKLDREGLNSLKKKLERGDTVHVESLSRLSRSMKDLLEQLEEFNQMGVGFHSIKENFDFSSHYGKLILTILAALVQFERDIISDRVKEGVDVARDNGKTLGRPPVSPEKVAEVLKLRENNNFSVKRITEMAGIGRSTYYRILKKEGLKGGGVHACAD